ncbi:MAG TPA: acetate--CoA ligase [Chloroflexota bacterium]|nr:acetate--CoA ligase [Chloroflexota bacterium]
MATTQPETGQSTADGSIDALLQEDRRYPPSEEFKARANWSDPSVYERADNDPQGFWAEQAQLIDWFKPWDTILEWNAPIAKWFVGAEVNASYNCVDRHLQTWRRNKAAIIFEGEPGDSRVLTYRDLYREVNRCAAALKRLGVNKGDRVAIYLGMIPELAIAMLACARIGAPHTVIFAGFSADSIADRINDSGATFAITSDGGWRRGNRLPLKETMDKALESSPAVTRMLVVNRTDDASQVSMREGRDIWWHEALKESGGQIVEPERLDSEHPLYILYTSGTTGKPKGMLHTTGGYLVGTASTHKYVFDLKEEDVFWCTADVGWVTGHSYIVYGPLANGATCVMYEGSPDYPDKDRFWDIVEKYAVSILYTAPTAIRTFMRWGKEYPAQHDLSTLRVLGTVGEPINPEAWVWYREVIGADRCPVVDTWWMTETGQILITPLPGITVLKPGSATFPFPGVKADVFDETGNDVPLGKGGYLVLKAPWPAMARTIWGDAERYKSQYWSRFEGNYFAGDGARRDEEGYYWLLGRVDDVLNVAGHRIGTMEIESALVSHPAVAEAAVIGITHEIKGQGIAAFCTLRAGNEGDQAMVNALRDHVGEKIGAIAKPDKVFFTAELPKTRSAKIMRRLLRDIAEGRVVGDTTTLADPAVLSSIKTQYEND